MKIYLIPFALLVASSMLLHAQGDRDRRITGEVFDAETDAPLSGATIKLYTAEDSTSAVTGAITTSSGSFIITTSHRGAVLLEASYVGYRSQRVRLEPEESFLTFDLVPSGSLQPTVKVTAARRTRSVEDACCRVESIRDEVQQHAPFAPSAADALSRYSSCTPSRVSCSIDNSSSIRLRGLEPTYVKMMIDGLPSFSGLGTFYGLSMIPSHALQTIRIAEGASSGLYGNGAISGIVDLQSRPPTELPELIISGNAMGERIGGPSGQDVNAGYTGMAGDVGIAAFGSLALHDDAPVAGGLERQYRRASGLVKGNLLVDDATEVTLTALGGWERRSGIHSATEASGEYNERVEVSRLDLAARLGRTLGENAELESGALLSMTGASGRYGASLLDASQRTLYAKLLYHGALDNHRFTAGGEIYNDRLTDRGGLGIGYNVTVPSLLMQDEITFSEQWSVLGSLRADHHSSAGFLLSPRGALKFAPLDAMTMRFMAGQGFKGEALFNEEHRVLHGIYRWRANDAFTYERSFTLNYDISYRFTIGEEFGADVNFNTYHTTIAGKGIPHRDSLAAGTIFYVNSDRPARLRGLELQFRPTLGAHWSGSFAFQLIDYTLQGDDGVYHRIPLAPRLNADASLMYRDEELGLALEGWGSHIGAQALPANPSGLTESVPYTLVNLRVEKTFGPVAIYAGVLNLLDETQIDTMPLEFELGEGRDGGIVWGPIEGRELFLGARLRFAPANQ